MNDDAELKRLQEQRDKKRLYNRNYYHQRVKPKKKKEKDDVAKMKEQLAQLTVSPGVQNIGLSTPNFSQVPTFGTNFNSAPIQAQGQIQSLTQTQSLIPIQTETASGGFSSFDFSDGSFTPRYREVDNCETENRLREEIQRLTDLLNRTRSDFGRLSEQNNVLKKDNSHLSRELDDLRHQLYELTIINSSHLLPQLN